MNVHVSIDLLDTVFSSLRQTPESLNRFNVSPFQVIPDELTQEFTRD